VVLMRMPFTPFVRLRFAGASREGAPVSIPMIASKTAHRWKRLVVSDYSSRQ
jgi:hypothetical protein